MKQSILNLKVYIKEAALAAQNLDRATVGDPIILRASDDSIIRPCYISQEECNKIAGLYRWLKCSEEIPEKVMLDVLKADEEFSFLVTLVEEVPEFIDTLKVHGPKSAAVLYINNVLYNKPSINK